MKNKRNWLGVLVMVLVFGMAVVGCDDDSAGSTNEENGNKIIITGINWSTGYPNDYVVINIWDETGSWIASGDGDISNNVATITMNDGWNGSGLYGIGLNIYGWDEYDNPIDSADDYFFTDGKTFAELGIVSDPSWSDQRGNLPKYNFTGTQSTIEFKKFKPWK